MSVPAQVTACRAPTHTVAVAMEPLICPTRGANTTRSAYTPACPASPASSRWRLSATFPHSGATIIWVIAGGASDTPVHHATSCSGTPRLAR